MKFRFSTINTCLLLAVCGLVGCRNEPRTAVALPSPTVTAVPLETPMVTPSITPRSADYSFLTLPVIDAFLADKTFAAEAQNTLALTNEQMTRLRKIAREETAKLREAENESYTYTTVESHAQAQRALQESLGAEKAEAFTKFVFQRWGQEGETSSVKGLPTEPNQVPTDTRIVVNTPAYRMDVFRAGQLEKTYKIGIGYPEFPIPVALRHANTIIFNPTWTPPDEPWVESPSSQVKVGETVPAGSRLNPLGLIKIPIGLPSLIHGGKRPAKLGTFASHGCVGLTDAQVQDFARLLADLSGTPLTTEQMAEYAQKRTETKNVKLPTAIPVELRYETIVVQDGKLHLYRDVYDRNTNTEEELRRVLQRYGVQLEDLSERELTEVRAALLLMARDAKGQLDNAASPSPTATKPTTKKVTPQVKGAKEMVIPIAALQGKGYPAPVKLDTGTTAKPAPNKPGKKK